MAAKDIPASYRFYSETTVLELAKTDEQPPTAVEEVS